MLDRRIIKTDGRHFQLNDLLVHSIIEFYHLLIFNKLSSLSFILLLAKSNQLTLYTQAEEKINTHNDNQSFLMKMKYLLRAVTKLKCHC